MLGGAESGGAAAEGEGEDVKRKPWEINEENELVNNQIFYETEK